MSGAQKAFLLRELLGPLLLGHLASSLLKVRQKGQRSHRDAGREKEGDLGPATGPPLTAPSSQRRGQLQPILNSHPCQTDWDCPELWPLRCGAWDPRQALSGHSQGAKLGEAGGRAGGRPWGGGGRVAGSERHPAEELGGGASPDWKPGEG